MISPLAGAGAGEPNEAELQIPRFTGRLGVDIVRLVVGDHVSEGAADRERIVERCHRVGADNSIAILSGAAETAKDRVRFTEAFAVKRAY